MPSRIGPSFSKHMNKIVSSASKLAFLLLAVTACVAFLWGKLEPKDFVQLASMAFVFYFSNKGETNSGLPYAGK